MASPDKAEEQIDTIIESSVSKILESKDTIIDTNTANTCKESTLNIEGFNAALHHYLEIEEEVKVLLTAIKQRNLKKKQLGLSLSSYLRENKIKNVNLGGSYQGKKLVSIASNTAVGFNKVSVTDAIYNELKDDEEVFGKIMEAISKKSVMKEIWKIKIVEEKLSKVNKSISNINTAEALLNDD